ncbi:hypothetical protein B0T13DRAFT_135196 [Neurospora crassa]|nr:hypothetical protein B0T13DRAFT_135196 [Neurospora crassa]
MAMRLVFIFFILIFPHIYIITVIGFFTSVVLQRKSVWFFIYRITYSYIIICHDDRAAFWSSFRSSSTHLQVALNKANCKRIGSFDEALFHRLLRYDAGSKQAGLLGGNGLAEAVGESYESRKSRKGPRIQERERDDYCCYREAKGFGLEQLFECATAMNSHIILPNMETEFCKHRNINRTKSYLLPSMDKQRLNYITVPLSHATESVHQRADQ